MLSYTGIINDINLNLTLQEIVRKEMLKLLDFGIIYHISNSEWVSPVQVC